MPFSPRNLGAILSNIPSSQQAYRRTHRLYFKDDEEEMKQSKFPPGWDAERVNGVLAHYDSQSEEQAVAEDEQDEGPPDY